MKNFDDWYDTVAKYANGSDIYQWMYEAWVAGVMAERDECASVCDKLGTEKAATSTSDWSHLTDLQFVAKQLLKEVEGIRYADRDFTEDQIKRWRSVVFSA